MIRIADNQLQVHAQVNQLKELKGPSLSNQQKPLVSKILRRDPSAIS